MPICVSPPTRQYLFKLVQYKNYVTVIAFIIGSYLSFYHVESPGDRCPPFSRDFWLGQACDVPNENNPIPTLFKSASNRALKE